MAGTPRCSICNRYGSSSLDGYCKDCYPKRYGGEDEKNVFADFCDDHEDDAFFPRKFGILKKKFGYEER